MPGSLEAYLLDRDLAVRLADDERASEDEPVSEADALDAIPGYDEENLPDPFATPPPELGRR